MLGPLVSVLKILRFLPKILWNKHHYPHLMDKRTEERVVKKLIHFPKLTNRVSDKTRTQNQVCVSHPTACALVAALCWEADSFPHNSPLQSLNGTIMQSRPALGVGYFVTKFPRRKMNVFKWTSAVVSK